MKVCIEKSQDGQFSVYQENEAETMPMQGGQMQGAMGGQEAESSEQQNKQPARDLQDALMIAGKMLSQDQGAGGESPFDAGLRKVLPQRPGMM